MSPRSAAPSSASMRACETTSPSECPARPRGCSIATPASTSATPSAKAWASNPMPTRSSLMRARLTRPAARRASRSSAPAQVPSGAVPTGHASRAPRRFRPRAQAGRRCRPGLRRTRARRSAHPASSLICSKKRGSGFRTPRLADDETTSAGSAASRAQRSRASVWFADDPDPEPELTNRLETRHGVGVEIIQLVRRGRATNPSGGRCRDGARARRAPRRARWSRRARPRRRAAGGRNASRRLSTSAPRRRASRRRRRRPPSAPRSVFTEPGPVRATTVRQRVHRPPCPTRT